MHGLGQHLLLWETAGKLKKLSRLRQEFGFQFSTWTPKVCRIMAFWLYLGDLGHYFTYFGGLGRAQEPCSRASKLKVSETKRATLGAKEIGFRV